MVDTIISIHSLVKRETLTAIRAAPTFTNFNPLPRKEGDYWTSKRQIPAERYFNPLPRKEGDLSNTARNVQQNDFNPLPRKEGDGILNHCFVIAILFQSTPS